MTTDPTKSDRKAKIDALLLTLPGVSARKINGLDAYFVSDKMFACISGDGIGLRLPVATATELQFSRNDVAPFSPGGVASTREWTGSLGSGLVSCMRKLKSRVQLRKQAEMAHIDVVS